MMVYTCLMLALVLGIESTRLALKFMEHLTNVKLDISCNCRNKHFFEQIEVHHPPCSTSIKNNTIQLKGREKGKQKLGIFMSVVQLVLDSLPQTRLILMTAGIRALAAIAAALGVVLCLEALLFHQACCPVYILSAKPFLFFLTSLSLCQKTPLRKERRRRRKLTVSIEPSTRLRGVKVASVSREPRRLDVLCLGGLSLLVLLLGVGLLRFFWRRGGGGVVRGSGGSISAVFSGYLFDGSGASAGELVEGFAFFGVDVCDCGHALGHILGHILGLLFGFVGIGGLGELFVFCGGRERVVFVLGQV